MKRFVFVSAGLVMGMVLTAQSQGTPRATDDVYRCAEITSDAERLACFDAAVATLRAAETAGVVRTVDTAGIQQIEREAFGFSLPNLRAALRGFSADDRDAGADGPDGSAAEVKSSRPEFEEIEEVTLAVSRISKNAASGRLTLYLQDGQVWEQIDSRKLPNSKTKSPKQVTIRRASLGSFKMTIDDSVAIRVKRTS